ncbi:plasmid mobilization relaxosome protein MobC, partial [Pseudomonas fluorescens]
DIVTIEKIFSQIGNNLNQIAAALNSGKQPNQDILDVLSKLDKNMGVLTNRLESLKKEKITIKGDI